MISLSNVNAGGRKENRADEAENEQMPELP